MNWYRSVARPLLFAPSPEASHRLARWLLALPLPWGRLGRAERDPSLELSLAGLRLANPIALAAGFDKTGRHVDALGRLGFGYVVCGTFTRRSRAGNPKPSIVRYPRRMSMTNAMGLPNPGAEAAARILARRPRPTPRVASIADEDVADARAAHRLLEPHVDAIELNVSCPNVSWGRDRDNEAHLAELLLALEDRATPLFVKLPPFGSDVERDVVLALAEIARAGHVDGLVCSNTRPVREPRLAAGSGGLSGAPLLETTVRNVSEVRRSVGDDVSIAASGGISTSTDAIACIEAGATTVQVYTGFIYRGPGIVAELTRGIASELRGRGAAVPDLVGSKPGA
jgi:dihydroorotate dehydrogenase